MSISGNLLIFTQWSFKDALVQTYTLPYVDIIRKTIANDRKIVLVTAEQDKIALSAEELKEINGEWKEKNMELIPQPYRRFGVKKMIASAGNLYRLYRVIKKEKITTIHAFCTPAGSIAYLLSKLSGASLIIDSYEPHAESMVENGTWKRNGAAFKLLFFLEKKQTKRARALIGTTAGMKGYALNKYQVDIKNFFVKPACVDLEKFSPKDKDTILLRNLGLENKIVCVYAGKLGGIYFYGEIFDFIKICYDHWKDDFRFLMLTNASQEEIKSEMWRVGLPDEIVISKFVFHNEIPVYLSLADFAINPVKPVPTKKYCTPIKDGEYWATGLPVAISPNISDDSGIIEEEGIGVIVNFDKIDEMSKDVLAIEKLLIAKTALRNKITAVAEKYRSFKIAHSIYQKIYS